MAHGLCVQSAHQGMFHPLRASRLAISAGLVAGFLTGVGPASASAGQAASRCQGASCELSVEDAFAAVTQISRQKQEFVAGVRQLIVALAGTFGDEGPRIKDTLQAMGTALATWDRTIQQFEAAVRAGNRPAEVHLALGVVYLDRYRLDAAQREFGEAARLNARRADAHTYQALVQTLLNKPAAAAAAFARAAAIDPGKPGLLYSQARQLSLAGQQAEAAKTLQAFMAAQQARLANPAATDDGRPPFERVALLRQTSGVAPIFPPALYAEAFARLARGAYPEALDLLKQAFERDPLSRVAGANDRLTDGGAALRAGNVPLAIQHLKAAIAAEPARAEAHRLLGVAFREADQYDESVAELTAAKGMTPRTVGALLPFMSALPQGTPVNVNTAPPEVLAAIVDDLTPERAEALLADRARKPFTTVAEFRARLPSGAKLASDAGLAVASSYFLITIDARQGTTHSRARALLHRSRGSRPSIVWQVIE